MKDSQVKLMSKLITDELEKRIYKRDSEIEMFNKVLSRLADAEQIIKQMIFYRFSGEIKEKLLTSRLDNYREKYFNGIDIEYFGEE